MNSEEIQNTAAMNLPFVNRSACSALEDMRNTLSAYNKVVTEYYDDKLLKQPLSVLASLVEELQVYFNRMDSALSDLHGVRDLRESYSDMQKQLEELRKEKNELTET